jgi:small subunit ribosomal protein S2
VALAVKDLIDAGVHFGHRASRWNPKMKPYIYGKRNLIHIIDLKETVRGLLRATKFFQRVAASGGLILFVGTKRQAADTIVEQCTRGGMPYVTERWLGGTLTNFRTIRSRLERLEELESILDGEQAASYSKKMISTLSRERRKIQRNLEGIRHMTRMPEALLVIDPHRERIAVTEARKLGIKVVALLDTDCDPDEVDLPIPGNDDSMRSIELVVRRLTDAIIEGKAAAPVEPPARAEGAEPQGAARGERRGERRGGPRRGGPEPGIGTSRGLASRTGGGHPVLAPTTEAGTVVAHGPEGTTPGNQIPESAPLGTERQAGINDQPAPTPDDTPTIAPAAVDTAHPGSRGETDIPPSAQ